MNTQVLASSGLPPEEHAEIARDLGNLSKRLNALTDSVSARKLESYQQFDPARVAADLVQMLNRSRLLKTDARIQIQGPACTLYGSISRYEQMLANLILNGDQATASAAPVELEILSKAHEVEILVSDSGAGIAAADLERIWDPLYTTKATGTGLGLLVVKDAVAAFNGQVTVTSAPGRGTRFSIYLPAQV